MYGKPNGLDGRKRKSGDSVLAAQAEAGSLKVKIMRFDTAPPPIQQQQGAEYNHSVASLGPPPSTTPSFGIAPQHSLLGGGIQRQPSELHVDTRTFQWLPGEGRPRSGSLPTYGLETALQAVSREV